MTTTTALTAAAVLAAHRATWDMPTFAADHLDMIGWVLERAYFDFDMAGNVVIHTYADNRLTQTGATDMRIALEGWLADLAATE